MGSGGYAARPQAVAAPDRLAQRRRVEKAAYSTDFGTFCHLLLFMCPLLPLLAQLRQTVLCSFCMLLDPLVCVHGRRRRASSVPLELTSGIHMSCRLRCEQPAGPAAASHR